MKAETFDQPFLLAWLEQAATNLTDHCIVVTAQGFKVNHQMQFIWHDALNHVAHR